MGNFTVEIEAVGGHGCQREKVAGEKVEHCGQPSCPDCLTRDFISKLKSIASVSRATLRHWPHTDSEVMDNLVTGIRRNSF